MYTVLATYPSAFLLLALLSSVAAAQSERDQLFDKIDRNGDGTLTADEIEEGQRKSFQRLLRVGDADGNGALTREEFHHGLRPPAAVTADSRGPGARRPGGRPQFDGREFFRRLDQNGDGKLAPSELPAALRDRFKPVFDRLDKQELTFQEFARARGALAGRTPEPEELFRRIDRDGDGKVAKSELPAFLERQFRSVFERLNKDEITRDEFVAAMRRREDPAAAFKRFDANDDGKLTLTELPEFLRPRFRPLFERLQKDSLTEEEFARGYRRRPPAPRSDGRFRSPESPSRPDAAIRRDR